MVPGRKVKLGGKEYEVPSLTARQLRVLEEQGLFDEVKDKQKLGFHVERAIKVIQPALARNYPDLTIDALWDLSPAELMDASHAVMQETTGGRPGSGKGEAVSPPASPTSSGS